MAEHIGAETWSIQGETITLPVTVTGARMTAAVFAARPAAVRPILAGTPLRPVVLLGRALAVLLCIHYDEWALKSYDEVGVGLLAAGPRGRPGLYLADLPVTGAFTCEAGRDFWALPKWLMDADLRFTPDRTEVAVRDISGATSGAGGTGVGAGDAEAAAVPGRAGPAAGAGGAGGGEVMRAVVRHGGLRLPFRVRAALPSWSYLDRGAQAGQLLRGRVPMRLAGVRTGRGAADIRLGDHPMAARMRALGMLGRPLLTVHADRLTGPMGTFRRSA